MHRTLKSTILIQNMKPTIEPENAIPDHRTDYVGRLLNAAAQYTTWSNQRRHLIASIIEHMEAVEHISFVSDNRLFRLTQVGQSLLYEVPSNKRGYLSPLRGRVIRLVCIHSGTRSWRGYMASVYSFENDSVTL